MRCDYARAMHHLMQEMRCGMSWTGTSDALKMLAVQRVWHAAKESMLIRTALGSLCMLARCCAIVLVLC